MVKNKRIHPADLPKNRRTRLPDYLKAPWASPSARLFARLLDDKQREANRSHHHKKGH